MIINLLCSSWSKLKFPKEKKRLELMPKVIFGIMRVIIAFGNSPSHIVAVLCAGGDLVAFVTGSRDFGAGPGGGSGPWYPEFTLAPVVITVPINVPSPGLVISQSRQSVLTVQYGRGSPVHFSHSQSTSVSHVQRD